MIDWEDCERYTYFKRDYAGFLIEEVAAERFLKCVAFSSFHLKKYQLQYLTARFIK